MAAQRCDTDHMCTMLASRVGGTVLEIRKGLGTVITVSRDTGAETWQGVAYKTGERGETGLMLNYCPWCGGKPGAFGRLDDEVQRLAANGCRDDPPGKSPGGGELPRTDKGG